MAGNSFNDFSSLKSLKKELEKSEAASAPSKVQNEPRKKIVRHKSKDEILGEEKGKEYGLLPGMKVTLMDSNDRGVIKHVRKDCVEIDLHIEALPGGLGVAKGQELPFQLEYFKRVMQSQLRHRGSRVIFVHGVGDGVLKAAIRKELDAAYAISCSWNPYGDGATAVTIK